MGGDVRILFHENYQNSRLEFTNRVFSSVAFHAAHLFLPSVDITHKSCYPPSHLLII